MITVLYSCESCGLKDREVIVPERDPDDDVVKYVREIIMECVGADHSTTSPSCRATHLANLKIPYDPNSNLPVGVRK